MIFTYFIRSGNFGYSKFTHKDNHYNPLVKQTLDLSQGSRSLLAFRSRSTCGKSKQTQIDR
jgi:hypothetical protein